jgi:predicted CXXCH cytochrome family protein
MECHNIGGPGSLNRPYVDAHAVGTALSADMSTTLPLDSATGSIGCLTCHDPHYPRSSEIATEAKMPPQKTDSEVPEPRSFLRHEGSHLCVLCHDKTGISEYAPHEPMEFEPAVRRQLAMHPSVGSCRVCHTTHNAQGPHLWARTPATDSGSPISNLCGTCHQDKLGAQDSAHDPGTGERAKQLDFTSRGSCVDCHPVHGSGKQDSIWAALGYKEAPVQLCEACHRAEGPGKVMETAHIGRTVGNNIENLPLGSDMRILCTTCHDIHQNEKNSKLLRLSNVDLCGTCHEDKLGVLDSVHDPGVSEWARELGFVSRGSCIDCHPIHGPARQGGIWESIKSEDTSPHLCETCHRPGAPGEAMETPHMENAFVKNSESLPENLVVGDKGRILCTTCHDIHHQRQNPKLLRFPGRDSGLCLGCHSEFSGLLDTQHDLRISAPDERNIRDEVSAESGPCGSCHIVHRTSRAGGVWAKGTISKSNFGSELCTCCHRRGQCAEEHVPEYVDHPDVPIVNRTSPQQPGHMPTFDSDGQRHRTGAVSCLTCHDPHAASFDPKAGNKTSPSHNRKFLRYTEHQGLCADCHGIEALWRFMYYHNENRNPHTE